MGEVGEGPLNRRRVGTVQGTHRGARYADLVMKSWREEQKQEVQVAQRQMKTSKNYRYGSYFIKDCRGDRTKR